MREEVEIWSCNMCGKEFKVENRLDPLAEALACPNHNMEDVKALE